jgi:phage baseplate assembly protein W
MAYRINNIDPLDLQARKAVGINLPFSVDGVFSSNFQTKDAIKNNIINFMLTGKGERFMNPTFGSGLRNFLFERIDTQRLDTLSDSISQEISFLFPKVNLVDLKINPDADRNTIELVMSYQIKYTNIADTVSINFI